MDCSLAGASHGSILKAANLAWARNGSCGVEVRVASRVVSIRRTRNAVVYCAAAGKTAVIVGAGPAGALLALLLARQDWKVDVFERKQWSGASWAPGQPDGWNVMLGARAAYCLESAGLKDEVWREGVLCSGRTAVTGTLHFPTSTSIQFTRV